MPIQPIQPWTRRFAVTWHCSRNAAIAPEDLVHSLNSEGLSHPITVDTSRDEPRWTPREWLFHYHGTRHAMLRTPLLYWNQWAEVLRVMQVLSASLRQNMEGPGMYIHVDTHHLSIASISRVMLGAYAFEEVLSCLVAPGRTSTGWADSLRQNWSTEQFLMKMRDATRDDLRETEGFAFGYKMSDATFVSRLHHGSFSIQDTVVWAGFQQMMIHWFLDYVRRGDAENLVREVVGSSMEGRVRVFRSLLNSLVDPTLRTLLEGELERVFGPPRVMHTMRTTSI